MFYSDKLMQAFFDFWLLISDRLNFNKHSYVNNTEFLALKTLRYINERVQNPQWYKKFQHRQGTMKCCKVLSNSYLYHVEPCQRLSLKHSGSDVSKASEGVVNEAEKVSENKLLFYSCNQCHFLTVMNHQYFTVQSVCFCVYM